MNRATWTLLHRWVGLVMAGFLVVVGLTGALLAWYHDLDHFFAADLHRISAAPGSVPLDPFSLREVLRKARPDADLNDVPLAPRESLRPVRFRVEGAIDPATGQRKTLPYTEFFADPVTGEVTGDRRYGDITQGFKNLMPFVLELHTSLALGVVGQYWFGIVALLWTLDCFVGAYLTFPLRAKRRNDGEIKTGRGWWQRWRPAWLVRWQGGAYRLNFDLHRASGLWLWAMLFVFAWSSVYFNLGEVYRPVMGALFGMRADAALVSRSSAVPVAFQAEPGIAWRDAHALGRERMVVALRQFGVRQVNEEGIGYDPTTATFSYSVSATTEAGADTSASIVGRQLSVSFDANSGVLRSTSIQPEARLGDVITEWLNALHVAGIWGLPYRIFVCFMGLAVTMLSATGVYVWWKKRTARNGLRSPVAAAIQRDRPIDAS